MEVFEKALNPRHITSLQYKTKGTGGPAIPLPDGTEVNRDAIVAALDEPGIKENIRCTDLIPYLNDERIHIRYGANHLLKTLLHNDTISFNAFADPGTSINKKARQEWETLCRQSGK